MPAKALHSVRELSSDHHTFSARSLSAQPSPYFLTQLVFKQVEYILSIKFLDKITTVGFCEKTVPACSITAKMESQTPAKT